MSLDTIFNEYIVSLDVVANIFLNQKIVSTVDCEDSSHGLVNSNTSHVAFRDFSSHMEMGTISSNNLWLTTTSELGITDLSD